MLRWFLEQLLELWHVLRARKRQCWYCQLISYQQKVLFAICASKQWSIVHILPFLQSLPRYSLTTLQLFSELWSLQRSFPTWIQLYRAKGVHKKFSLRSDGQVQPMHLNSFLHWRAKQIWWFYRQPSTHRRSKPCLKQALYCQEHTTITLWVSQP